MPYPVLPDLPAFPLLDGPSPLQAAPRFARALGGGFELWVKREDLLPLAFGGNKLRNLEYLVGEAIAEGADTLVTAGRRWSNHCRLTAAAGARAGLDVHLVLSGPRGPSGDGPNVRVERLLGATIHQLETAGRTERDAAIARVVDDLRAARRKPHVIPVGGSSVTGAFGQVVAGVELATQVATWPSPPDLVVLPSATGGTQAGLLVGSSAAGLDVRIVGVVVARPVDELRPAIETSVRELASLVAITPPVDRIELNDAHIGGGYGVPSAAASDAASLLARTEAVLTDPIYTAKAVAWIVAAARAGELAGRRGRVLACRRHSRVVRTAGGSMTDDGRIRCWWGVQPNDPLYRAYHDEEWGVPTRDERDLFELLVLEGAQAGLSWSTILHKRDGYRKAFAGFDPDRVAAFGEDDVERLMGDAGIVRNRLKVTSAIDNARAMLALRDGPGFSERLWSFVGGSPRINRFEEMGTIPAETDESRAMSKDLKRRGFRFVGPTVCYAFMQSAGMVNDHVTSCFRWSEVQER